MDETLCPNDARRNPYELFSKVIFVHITTTAAYCHLLSIRGERIVRWRLVLYLLCPWILYLECGLGLLALGCSWIYTVCAEILSEDESAGQDQDVVERGVVLDSPYRDHAIEMRELPSGERDDSTALHAELAARHASLRAAVARGPKVLFGRISDTSDQDTQSSPTEQDKTIWDQLIMKSGRIFVVLFLLVQCICSIVVFSRRKSHDALTEGDRRVFDLACGGLLVCLLTAVYLVWEPTVEADRLDTNIDKTLLWVRDVPAKGTSFWTLSRLELTTFMATGVSIFQGRVHLLEAILAYLTEHENKVGPRTIRHTEIHAEANVFSRVMPTLSFIIFIVMTCVSGANRRKSRDTPCGQICNALGMPFLGVFCALLGSLLAVGFMSPVLTLVATWRQWDTIISELHQLAVWPVDKACPLLWQDPQASVLWGLF